jgi:hypothetical protein
MVLGFSHTLGDECACRQYLNQSEELLRLHVATRTLVAVAKSVRGRHVALGYRRCCSMMPGQSEKSRRADGGPSMARELAVTLTTCSMLSIPADVTEQPNVASTENVTIATEQQSIVESAEAVSSDELSQLSVHLYLRWRRLLSNNSMRKQFVSQRRKPVSTNAKRCYGIVYRSAPGLVIGLASAYIDWAVRV